MQLKSKATAVCFQLPPKYQVLLKARFDPSSPFWISSSLLYLHIFSSVLKNMEAHLVEWTAKCSDIQEKSTALDKTVAGWPFADMSEIAFTAHIQDVGKNTDFLFQKSRSYRPDFRDMYNGYFQGIREFATTNETKVLQGLRCPGFSPPAVAVHMAKCPVQQHHPKRMPHHWPARCAWV